MAKPDWVREVRARLSSLQLSPTRESEIVEELSQHLDDRWRELVAGGADPDDAARAALAEFSPRDVLARQMAPLRQAQTPVSITPGAPTARPFAGLVQNVRYAARLFRKRPGFAAAAVLTLALGIGAATAIFSVVYGILLKPLPFDEPDRLVALYHLAPGFGPARNGPQSPATYFTYRAHARVFEDIGLWRTDDVTITRSGVPESLQALRVTDGLLPLLGIRPALGRLVRGEDDVPGAPNRVVLTHGYWLRTFGGARDIVGRTLVIDAAPYEIVGVVPASFKLLDTSPQVLLPLRLDRATAATGTGFTYRGVARLKPAMTLAQANDDIARIIPLIVEQFPLLPGITRHMWREVGLAPNVRPLSEDVIGDVGRSLWILLGAVGIVLLMAWANVANLLLVRAEGRWHELAVRVALGASRGRLAIELLAESLVLALAGGAAGVLLAQACIVVLRRLAPVELPRVDDIAIDATVLLFTLALSIVGAVLVGLLPAWRFGVIDMPMLKDAGRSVSDAPARHRVRHTLVVAQVALALVLLIVSGLMVRTFLAMADVQPGFTRPHEVQTFRIMLPSSVVDSRQVTPTHERIARQLQQAPGVVAVGLTTSVTMDGSGGMAPVFVQDRPVAGTPPPRRVKLIGPCYFETLGNPVVAGRALTWIDITQRRPVALVSENLAREYWHEPGKALGRFIRAAPQEPWSEIIGVVGNERDDGLNRPAPAIVYWSMGSGAFARRNMAYVVRSSRAGSADLSRDLQQAVATVNANVPLASVQTLREIQSESMARTSFAMVMLAIAAGVALLLGVVGIYGVIRYIAEQRTREIGIRMALGAQAGHVRRLFVRHGLALTLAGIVLGLAAASALTRVMSALLFGVGPLDPLTYLAASLGLVVIALLAAWLPARRASAIDPVVALRSDA